MFFSVKYAPFNFDLLEASFRSAADEYFTKNPIGGTMRKYKMSFNSANVHFANGDGVLVIKLIRKFAVNRVRS